MFNEKEQDDRKTKKRVEDSILHPLKLTPATKLLALTEGPFVVDDQPSFLFCNNCWGQGDHACAGTTILNHPE